MSQNTSGMGGRRSHISGYPYAVEGDSRRTNSATNQSCGMIAITIDSTSNTQVFNGGIAYISEESGCCSVVLKFKVSVWPLPSKVPR